MVDRYQQEFTQEIRFLDKSVILKSGIKSSKMPESFAPGPWSVLCGRGRETYNHVGNRRLRVLVEANLPKYAATKSKIQKTIIISSIVDTVREAAGMGGFVKVDNKTGRYIEIDDGAAKEKVGQMLRESQMRKNPAKLAARKEKRRVKAQKKKNKTKAIVSIPSNQSLSCVSTTSTDDSSATVVSCSHHDSSSDDGSMAGDSVSTASLPPASSQTTKGPIADSSLPILSLANSMPALHYEPLSLKDMNTVANHHTGFGFPDLTFF